MQKKGSAIAILHFEPCSFDYTPSGEYRGRRVVPAFGCQSMSQNSSPIQTAERAMPGTLMRLAAREMTISRPRTLLF